METRKLQQVGGGTFTVSIPKEWATEHALEAGAEVHLYTHSDGSVVVRSAARDGGHLDEARVDLGSEDGPGIGTDATTADDADDTARVTRTLRAAQTAGFETVTLTRDEGFDDAQRRAARALASDLVGTDVVAEDDSELAVRNLLDAGDVSVRQSVVQLQFVACSVHRAATTALVEGDGEAADRLRDRRDEAERLFGMVARHCNRALTSLATVDRLGVSRPELFDYCETARHLRDVADAGVRIAAVAERLSDAPADPVAETVARLGARSRAVVEDAAGAVLEGTDIGAAHAALDDAERVAADVDAVEAALFAGVDGATDPTADAAVATDGAGETEGSPAVGDLSGVSATDRLALARALDPLARTADHGGRVARVALRAAIRDANGDAGAPDAADT
jgi:phosphate uptake regulator